MNQESASIFRRYFTNESLVDRFLSNPAGAVDVLIPVLHTNELWESNLLSIYREIPVNRLLVGDGGCTDDSIQIACQFPRVAIFDHSRFVSLGYSIRKLIEAVETEWFVYLHSDVYLPEGWFDTMVRYQSDFDWFECNRRKTVLLDYPDLWQNAQKRPFSGSQMGRRGAFEPFLDRIDDDYLYRNEDLVIRELLEHSSGRYGRVAGTFHHHQIMNKPGLQEPDFVRVEFTRDEDVAWITRTYDMQARGIIKYTRPSKGYLVRSVQRSLEILSQYNALDMEEFSAWTESTNSNWLSHIEGWGARMGVIRTEVACILRSLLKIVQVLVPGVSQSWQHRRHDDE
ncbi:glycosyltransferase family 2 protein [Chloroflexota bacterium]